MDKIRENSFAIGVGALSLGLLVLMYFMIVGPLLGDLGGGSGSVTSRLEGLQRRMKDYTDENRTPQFPTEELVEAKEERQVALKQALTDAVAFMDEKARSFNQFFDGGPPLPAAEFRAKYISKIDELVASYKDRYTQARDQGDPGDRRSFVPGLTVSTKSDFPIGPDEASHVARGMKEYWVIEQIFKTAMDLDIGGLKVIDFPERAKEIEGLPSHYDAIRCRVKVEMPLSKLDNFIRGLLRSDRVPFELRKCTFYRKPDTIVAESIKVLEYENKEFEKQQADLEAHPGPEPEGVVEMELWAIDWLGLPEPTAEDESDKS